MYEWCVCPCACVCVRVRARAPKENHEKLSRLVDLIFRISSEILCAHTATLARSNTVNSRLSGVIEG